MVICPELISNGLLYNSGKSLAVYCPQTEPVMLLSIQWNSECWVDREPDVISPDQSPHRACHYPIVPWPNGDKAYCSSCVTDPDQSFLRTDAAVKASLMIPRWWFRTNLFGPCICVDSDPNYPHKPAHSSIWTSWASCLCRDIDCSSLKKAGLV